jgi:hypothetical protein
MSEADRALAHLAAVLQGEFLRGRTTPPIFELHPGLVLTIAIVTTDQLRPELPQLFATPTDR